MEPTHNGKLFQSWVRDLTSQQDPSEENNSANQRDPVEEHSLRGNSSFASGFRAKTPGNFHSSKPLANAAKRFAASFLGEELVKDISDFLSGDGGVALLGVAIFPLLRRNGVSYSEPVEVPADTAAQATHSSRQKLVINHPVLGKIEFFLERGGDSDWSPVGEAQIFLPGKKVPHSLTIKRYPNGKIALSSFPEPFNGPYLVLELQSVDNHLGETELSVTVDHTSQQFWNREFRSQAGGNGHVATDGSVRLEKFSVQKSSNGGSKRYLYQVLLSDGTYYRIDVTDSDGQLRASRVERMKPMTSPRTQWQVLSDFRNDGEELVIPQGERGELRLNLASFLHPTGQSTSAPPPKMEEGGFEVSSVGRSLRDGVLQAEIQLSDGRTLRFPYRINAQGRLEPTTGRATISSGQGASLFRIAIYPANGEGFIFRCTAMSSASQRGNLSFTLPRAQYDDLVPEDLARASADVTETAPQTVSRPGAEERSTHEVVSTVGVVPSSEPREVDPSEFFMGHTDESVEAEEADRELPFISDVFIGPPDEEGASLSSEAAPNCEEPAVEEVPEASLELCQVELDLENYNPIGVLREHPEALVPDTASMVRLHQPASQGEAAIFSFYGGLRARPSFFNSSNGEEELFAQLDRLDSSDPDHGKPLLAFPEWRVDVPMIYREGQGWVPNAEAGNNVGVTHLQCDRTDVFPSDQMTQQEHQLAVADSIPEGNFSGELRIPISDTEALRLAIPAITNLETESVTLHTAVPQVVAYEPPVEFESERLMVSDHLIPVEFPSKLEWEFSGQRYELQVIRLYDSAIRNYRIIPVGDSDYWLNNSSGEVRRPIYQVQGTYFRLVDSIAKDQIVFETVDPTFIAELESGKSSYQRAEGWQVLAQASIRYQMAGLLGEPQLWEEVVLTGQEASLLDGELSVRFSESGEPHFTFRDTPLTIEVFSQDEWNSGRLSGPQPRVFVWPTQHQTGFPRRLFEITHPEVRGIFSDLSAEYAHYIKPDFDKLEWGQILRRQVKRLTVTSSGGKMTTAIPTRLIKVAVNLSERILHRWINSQDPSEEVRLARQYFTSLRETIERKVPLARRSVYLNNHLELPRYVPISLGEGRPTVRLTPHHLGDFWLVTDNSSHEVAQHWQRYDEVSSQTYRGFSLAGQDYILRVFNPQEERGFQAIELEVFASPPLDPSLNLNDANTHEIPYFLTSLMRAFPGIHPSYLCLNLSKSDFLTRGIDGSWFYIGHDLFRIEESSGQGPTFYIAGKEVKGNYREVEGHQLYQLGDTPLVVERIVDGEHSGVKYGLLTPEDIRVAFLRQYYTPPKGGIKPAFLGLVAMSRWRMEHFFGRIGLEVSDPAQLMMWNRYIGHLSQGLANGDTQSAPWQALIYASENEAYHPLLRAFFRSVVLRPNDDLAYNQRGAAHRNLWDSLARDVAQGNVRITFFRDQLRTIAEKLGASGGAYDAALEAEQALLQPPATDPAEVLDAAALTEYRERGLAGREVVELTIHEGLLELGLSPIAEEGFDGEEEIRWIPEGVARLNGEMVDLDYDFDEGDGETATIRFECEGERIGYGIAIHPGGVVVLGQTISMTDAASGDDGEGPGGSSGARLQTDLAIFQDLNLNTLLRTDGQEWEYSNRTREFRSGQVRVSLHEDDNVARVYRREPSSLKAEVDFQLVTKGNSTYIVLGGEYHDSVVLRVDFVEDREPRLVELTPKGLREILFLDGLTTKRNQSRKVELYMGIPEAAKSAAKEIVVKERMASLEQVGVLPTDPDQRRALEENLGVRQLGFYAPDHPIFLDLAQMARDNVIGHYVKAMLRCIAAQGIKLARGTRNLGSHPYDPRNVTRAYQAYVGKTGDEGAEALTTFVEAAENYFEANDFGDEATRILEADVDRLLGVSSGDGIGAALTQEQFEAQLLSELGIDEKLAVEGKPWKYNADKKNFNGGHRFRVILGGEGQVTRVYLERHGNTEAEDVPYKQYNYQNNTYLALERNGRAVALLRLEDADSATPRLVDVTLTEIRSTLFGPDHLIAQKLGRLPMAMRPAVGALLGERVSPIAVAPEPAPNPVPRQSRGEFLSLVRSHLDTRKGEVDNLPATVYQFLDGQEDTIEGGEALLAEVKVLHEAFEVLAEEGHRGDMNDAFVVALNAHLTDVEEERVDGKIETFLTRVKSKARRLSELSPGTGEEATRYDEGLREGAVLWVEGFEAGEEALSLRDRFLLEFAKLDPSVRATRRFVKAAGFVMSREAREEVFEQRKSGRKGRKK